MYNAKNGNVIIGDSDMNYISFGKGDKYLVMIPGLGDGLKTVKGMALTFAFMYRKYAKNYKVFVFSRKNNLPKEYTIADMAKDQTKAMKKLGIEKAYVMGVSQGGMIAMRMAIDQPKFVERLILAVTTARANDTVKGTINSWISLAEENDYSRLFINTTEKSYSEKKLKSYRKYYPLVSRIGKPKSFDRFLIQANACLLHNAYDELDKITCPTLVIGGDNDQVVGPDSSKELNEQIRGSSLILYKGLGHMTYEEAKDFHTNVIAFLNKQ